MESDSASIKEYLRSIVKPADFRPTGVTKNLYLDMMELAVEAYPKEELEERAKEYELKPVADIQAYSRITSILGILIANGRKQDYRPLWEKMMDACCRDIIKDGQDAKPDFSVKELMLVYKAMKDFVDEEKRAQWLKGLRAIDRDKLYEVTYQKHGETIHNINIYNMAGEFLRETEGLTDTAAYFDVHWPIQFKKFDQNCMYQDPGQPMLYDLATRIQMQYITGFGYRGKYRDKMDEILQNGALCSLLTQSSAFVFPYGGRSNQYQFNEALLASCFEYEAVRYQKMGDSFLAGIYKRAAHLAAQSIYRWISNIDPPRHIKNFYPIESKFGTETYGYYDKYMATLGSFIYLAFLFADDTIEEMPCPAEFGGYIFETSSAFHKIFANSCGHSIEIDTNADFDYDATGIGRYHRKGFPVELALSVPFAKDPHYVLEDGLQKKNLSICPGWDDGEGGVQFLSELNDGLAHSLNILTENSNVIAFELIYKGDVFKGCKGMKETYILDQNGVKTRCELIEPMQDKIYYQVPLFVTNGKDQSTITWTENEAVVQLDQYHYKVSTNGSISIDDTLYGNRNGAYKRAFMQKAGSSINVNLALY